MQCLALPAAALALSLATALLTAPAALAQGQLPGGTISGAGVGPYTYSLTFSDAAGAGSPIGSVWYAWVPGEFYLPSTPTSASAPSGWTATVFGNSIQYVASSAANDIQPGSSLSGFGYTAAFSPAALASTAHSGTSVAYSGGLFSDGGSTFDVQPAPEPGSVALFGVGAVALIGSARNHTRNRK